MIFYGRKIFMQNIVEIWKQVLEIIKPEFSQMKVSYDTWIETIIPLEISETSLKIQVPYPYNKEMIDLRYTNLIKNAVKFITGYDVELDIEVATELSEKEVMKIKKQTNLNPMYTFDSFVVGKSNELAHATCVAIAEGRAKACNPLFLYGGVGLGKTHLMHAIGNYMINKDVSKKILYVSSENFTNDVIFAIQSNTMPAFREKYRTVDVLMVDDIQFIGNKEATQEEFFNTFNELYQNNKIIITTADRPPKDLPTFMDRLKNRLGMGAPIDINPPDYETRIAILKKKANQLSIEIPDNVYEYIAKNIKTNIRDLEGAVKKIMIHHMLIKKEINLDLAEEALKDIIEEKKKKITPDLILSNVEKYFKLKENDLKSSSKSQNIAFPRQIAMYILKNETNLSLKQIGDLFGGKDHTTVMYAVDKIEKAKADDASVDKVIQDLINELKN